MHLGPITLVGVDASAWNSLPTLLGVAGDEAVTRSSQKPSGHGPLPQR
ncbi:hypothetical protein AB0E10_44740 [Streptomyces sp. NPDC048045]